MKLIKITEENKYEIVSKLREFKHKIIDLSPQEFDIILPIIKGYIYSIDILKGEFKKRLKEYDEIIISDKYKTWRKSFGEFLAEKTVDSELFLKFFDMTINHSVINVFEGRGFSLKGPSMPMATDCLCYGLRIMINASIKSSHSKLLSLELHELFLMDIFGKTLDFKFLHSDEYTCFTIKKINFMKIATYQVLSVLENVALNNEEEAKQINEKIKKIKDDYTEAERAIAELVQQGLIAKEIAEKRGVSVNTVKSQVNKLGGIKKIRKSK